ncbi:SH3-like domain-containing protein [Nocardia barduliensis]|uniref:SH3-like domain-containing protein n=1 Tax=Nocardia barduliensis TaxID=2736643 RepID=UPI001571D04F|nr:SH3-like domain-containing protein [Nocardia barduliensis]
MTNGPYDVLLHTLDPESRRESTLPELDRKPDPWESSMQATCECLSWRGALDNLERRHAEDALGETIYHDFPVRTRPVVVTAHTLMDRGVITPEELRARMDAVRERFHQQ